MNIFSANSLLGRFLNLIADIFILNILWLICSLPIFTIGASTTALYYAYMKRQRRDEGYFYRNFFYAFKENFKQSTIIWLVLVAIALLLNLDYQIATSVSGPMGTVMLVGCIFISVPVAFLFLYIFPIQAKFENSIKDNLKNALLFAIAHFGYTLLIVFFLASFVVLSFISKAFLGVVLFFGFSLYAYLTSNIFIMIFRKHLPDELEEDIEASGIDKLR